MGRALSWSNSRCGSRWEGKISLIPRECLVWNSMRGMHLYPAWNSIGEKGSFLLDNSFSFPVYGNPVATAFWTSELLVDSKYNSALRSEAFETNDSIAVLANLEVVSFLLAQMTNSCYLVRHYLTITRLFYVGLFPGPLCLFFKGLVLTGACWLRPVRWFAFQDEDQKNTPKVHGIRRKAFFFLRYKCYIPFFQRKWKNILIGKPSLYPFHIVNLEAFFKFNK